MMQIQINTTYLGEELPAEQAVGRVHGKAKNKQQKDNLGVTQV